MLESDGRVSPPASSERDPATSVPAPAAARGPLERIFNQVGIQEAFLALGGLLDEAVFVVDQDRNIIFWSAGAERLLGYRADEVLGQYCLKANRCVSCMRGCGISEHGEVRNVPIHMYGRHGSDIPVRKTGRAFFDENGSFLGGIEVLKMDPNIGTDLSTAASAGERTRIALALEESKGHVGRAAEALGISRATLWRKRKRYDL